MYSMYMYMSYVHVACNKHVILVHIAHSQSIPPSLLNSYIHVKHVHFMYMYMCIHCTMNVVQHEITLCIRLYGGRAISHC